eukprot:Skav204232  [mRNA]  locus=scaffold1550:215415:216030:- [translate_table: standard]
MSRTVALEVHQLGQIRIVASALGTSKAVMSDQIARWREELQRVKARAAEVQGDLEKLDLLTEDAQRSAHLRSSESIGRFGDGKSIGRFHGGHSLWK